MGSIWDNLEQHVPLQKYGRIPDIDANDSNEEVWDGTGPYSFLAAETVLTVSSSGANDTILGTGARTISFLHQDDNGIETLTTVEMNGQSAAATTLTAKRVYRGRVILSGSSEVNEGDIWIGHGSITAGVPANIVAGMIAGRGNTLMAIYTIPTQLADGRKINGAKLVRWYATCGAGQAAFATVSLDFRKSGQSWNTQRMSGIGEGGWMVDTPRLDLDSLEDVRVRVVDNGVNNSSIEAGFDIALFTQPGK